MSVNVARVTGNGQYLLGHTMDEHLRYLSAESAGIWLGKGMAPFGLEGQDVEPVAFMNMLDGVSPDGKWKVRQNALSPTQARGWELAVGPHKSVDTLLAILPPGEQQTLLACHDTAVRKVVEHMESLAGQSRRGKNGATTEPAGLCVAVHRHLASRNNDPLIHSHLTVMNVGYRASDRTFGAISSKPIYQHQRLLNAIYHQTLARELRQRLGIVCDRDGFAARVRGVPEKLLQAFSTRSAEIAGLVGPKGSRSPRAAAMAALATRAPKQLLPLKDLLARWADQARQHGFRQTDLCRKPARNLTAEQAEKLVLKAMARAARELTQDSAHFSKRELLTATISPCFTKPVELEVILQIVGRCLAQPQAHGLAEVGRWKGEPAFTTQEHLKLETKLAQLLDHLAAKADRPLSEAQMAKILARHPELSQEQQRAIKFLTNRKRFTILNGLAGTGKTSVLRVVKELLTAQSPWWQPGKPARVIGCAVSGVAADQLQRATGIPSFTVAKLLRDLRYTSHWDVFKWIRQQSFPTLGALLKAAQTTRQPRLHLDARTTVVVDEHSLVNTKDFYRLVREVARKNARLVLVGDAGQLQAIGPAGGLDYVLSRFPDRAATLREIRRQQQAWERDTIKAVAEGRGKEALAEYEKRGRLHVARNQESAAATLVQLYANGGGLTQPRHHLILANRKVDVALFNNVIQMVRLNNGLLGKKALRIVRDGKVVGHIHRGDRILFLKNGMFPLLPERNPQLLKRETPPPRQRVRNGQFATVEKTSPLRGRLTAVLDTGERISVKVRKYPHLQLGYAITIFKSQSLTTEKNYAFVSGRVNQESAYVQLSRARHVTHLVTTQYEYPQLGNRMSTSERKLMAIALQALAAKDAEQQQQQAQQQQQQPSLGR